jgi:hypothetical protein
MKPGKGNRMFRSIGFPDPTTGEYLKTTAESAEAAERDLSVYVPHSRISPQPLVRQ